jgi:hypothetical protein
MIREFRETFDFGFSSGRLAYVINANSLPASQPGAQWREEKSFDESAQLRRHPTFSRVVCAVEKRGHATVSINSSLC